MTIQAHDATSGRSPAEILEWSRAQVEPALRTAIAGLPPSVRRIADFHFGGDGRATLAAPGTFVRAALTLLVCDAVGGVPGDALPAAVAVELVHNFSLMHHDIMNGGGTRRHRATVWAAFGPGPALLCGDALLGLAFDVLDAGGKSHAAAAADSLALTVQDVVEGQASDGEYETRDDVSLTECLRVARLKTGSLLACSTGLGALMGGADSNQIAQLRLYGELLGVAHQLVEDSLGIWGEPVTANHDHADLRRRKKTLPVVAALVSGTVPGQELAELYRQRGDLSDRDLVRAADLIEAAGGRAASRSQADELLLAAVRELATGAVSGRAVRELEGVARMVAGRDH
ncbi:polyprenyl synthetase family protein [Kribbella sp. NPDC051770]|uniref:polyprenyl synthetase family protein n=1 Tax=Kribbella sp. NPDC051770 TaxID=3155413 RepID=UPI003431142C